MYDEGMRRRRRVDRSDADDKDRWGSVYSSTVLIFPMSSIKLGSLSCSLQLLWPALPGHALHGHTVSRTHHQQGDA